MSNSNFHFDPNPAKHNSLLQLGYLTNSHQPKPFVLGLEDLSNLFVVGSRALDIYYKMFIQLCDEQKIPILVFMGVEATGDEDEICESPIWNLNLLTEIISFNLLDFTEGHYLFQYISILISLLEDFAPLSSTARNLLHIIFWKALFNVYKPTFQYFQSILYTYRHYGAVYNELCRLLVAIPQEFFMLNYDTLSLNRIQHLPTIISGFDSPKTNFAMNLLLLKLLTHGHETLPPLFLVNPPDLNPKLFQWLSARYASVKSPLVIFDTKSEITTTNLHIPYNYIVTNSNIAPPSPIRQNLTKDEQLFLKDNCDYMAVRLRSIPETCFVTIF